MAQKEHSRHAAGISVRVAAARTGLHPATVRRYIQLGLVELPLTADDLATIRRIRRLCGLGVNLAGVEVILHMRRRMEELLSRVQELETLVEDLELERQARALDEVEIVEAFWWEE